MSTRNNLSNRPSRLLWPLYFTKALIFTLLFPLLASGECTLETSQIKPAVKSALNPLHQKINIFISEPDFQEALMRIEHLKSSIEVCEAENRAKEKEFHLSQQEEKSDIYRRYSWALDSITLQLKAGINSFELGMLRPFAFRTSQWEKVANEFYIKEI